MKKNYLKKKLSLSLDIIEDSSKFIYFSIGLFLFFALIGFLVPAPDFFIEQIRNFIKDIVAQTENMNWFELTNFIFLNNLRSSFTGLIYGVIFGIPSLLISITNGYLIGFVGNLSVGSAGITSLWRLLPHGIFELLAIFISLGLGINFGFNFIKNSKDKLRSLVFFPLAFIVISSVMLEIFNRTSVIGFSTSLINLFSIFLLIGAFYLVSFIVPDKDRRLLFELFRKNLVAFSFIVIPLLFVAAIIEGFLIIFM